MATAAGLDCLVKGPPFIAEELKRKKLANRLRDVQLPKWYSVYYRNCPHELEAGCVLMVGKRIIREPRKLF